MKKSPQKTCTVTIPVTQKQLVGALRYLIEKQAVGHGRSANPDDQKAVDELLFLLINRSYLAYAFKDMRESLIRLYDREYEAFHRTRARSVSNRKAKS